MLDGLFAFDPPMPTAVAIRLAGGIMTLAIGWPHEPGETERVTRDPGRMTLAIGWPHDHGEDVGPWPMCLATDTMSEKRTDDRFESV
jgi:hypothetical protein